MYESSKLSSCSLCQGTGFIINSVREIYKHNINEDLEKKTPYIYCNHCLGTGKKEYEKVLNIICSHN